MAEYIVKDTELTSIANAIRAKSGGSGQLEFPNGFVSEINGIDSGYSIADAIEHKYSGNIVYNGTANIPIGLFFNCTNLTGFSAPNVTSISHQTSDGYTGNGNAYTFFGCTNLESINLPKITSLYFCDYAFYNCNKITNWGIDFHKIIKLGGHSLRNSSIPTVLAFPCLGWNTETYASTFRSTNLQKIDFGTGLYRVTSDAFNTSNINTLVLRRPFGVVSLINMSAFTNTPFASAGTGGTLYVPSNLISSYEQATNWSTLLSYENNNIEAIEGSQYEYNLVDGTPVSYYDMSNVTWSKDGGNNALSSAIPNGANGAIITTNTGSLQIYNADPYQRISNGYTQSMFVSPSVASSIRLWIYNKYSTIETYMNEIIIHIMYL